MRSITSRRSAVVATPPTVLLRPGALGSPIAGPTTDIEAAPTCVPDELSTRNCISAGEDFAGLQPAGAGSPDGSVCGEAFFFGSGLDDTAACVLVPFAFASAAALARRSCVRRRARL